MCACDHVCARVHECARVSNCTDPLISNYFTSPTLALSDYKEPELRGLLAAICAVCGLRWHPALFRGLRAQGEYRSFTVAC